ncbi:acyltransferase family protein [Sulfurospirillum sp. 1612]|uniref:acyltransferase family protein n=1 Tax=Sulfurospirillum sp. 1612 TaxID=3094835 RepID=UPI002F9389C3
MNNQLSNTLNFLRWFAALMVVVGHLRSFLFVEYNLVENKTIFIKLFYFITGFGHQAVIVFFVISGYLVGGAVLKKYKENKLNNEYIKSYFIKRFTRIYIVLIPALIIGYILDYYGNINFSDLYTNVFHISSMNSNVSEHLSLLTLVGNMLNLQTIFVSTLGTNGPLWSLANEWSYYILFILLFINNWTRILFLGIVVLLVFKNIDILIYSSIWFMGSYIVLVKKRLIHRYLAVTILFIILILSRKYNEFYIDLALALSISLLINSLKNDISSRVYFKNLNHKMADFSYSLYLFHFPFFVFLISVFYIYGVNSILMQPTITNLLYYFSFMLLIYLYVYLLFFVFEKNTINIQKYLIKKKSN